MVFAPLFVYFSGLFFFLLLLLHYFFIPFRFFFFFLFFPYSTSVSNGYQVPLIEREERGRKKKAQQ